MGAHAIETPHQTQELLLCKQTLGMILLIGINQRAYLYLCHSIYV